MPGRGPAPARRSRKGGTLATVTTLPGEPEEFSPPELPNADAYCPATRAWYDQVARLPQARQWGPGNWLLLQQTAPIACAYYCGELKHGAELRIRQTKLEVTDDDLRRAAGSAVAAGVPASTGRKVVGGAPDPRSAGDPRSQNDPRRSRS